jgi:hypothetical protein
MTERSTPRQRILEALWVYGPLCWSDLRKYGGYAASTTRAALRNWHEVEMYEDHEGAKLYRATITKKQAQKQRGLMIMPDTTTKKTPGDPVEQPEPAQEGDEAPAEPIPAPTGDQSNAPTGGDGKPPAAPEVVSDDDPDPAKLQRALDDAKRHAEGLTAALDARTEEKRLTLEALSEVGVATHDPVSGVGVLAKKLKTQGDLLEKLYELHDKAPVKGETILDTVRQLVTDALHNAKSAPPKAATS